MDFIKKDNLKMKNDVAKQRYYIWDSPHAGHSLEDLDIFEPHSIQYLFSGLLILIININISNILFTLK